MTDAFLSPQFLLFARQLAKTPPFPADNQIIRFNFALNQWELSTGGILSAVQSSSNVGLGAGLALPRVGDDLPFKSLLGNPEIVLTPTPTTIDFSVGAIAQSKITDLVADLLTKIETLTNVGTGSEIAKAKVGVNVDIRRINGISPISVVENVDDISISIGGSGFVFPYTAQRRILVIPSSNNNIIANDLGVGLLTTEGATISGIEAGNGYQINFVSGVMAGSDAGFFSLDGGINGEVTRRDYNFDVTIKFQTLTNITNRMWIGFTLSDLLGTDTPIVEHFALRLSGGATNPNYVISHSDGVTQAETQIASFPQPNAFHTIRLVSVGFPTGIFRASFDGGAFIDFATNIPAGNTSLGFQNELRTTGAGARTLEFWFFDGVSDL